MKATQLLYIFLFLGIIVFVVKSTHLLDTNDGFEDIPLADPVIAKGIKEQRLPIQAQPNASAPGTLPFGPYSQTAAVGSYQYQDPAQMPAVLQQMRTLYADVRSFLVFEGVQVANSSDPTVTLPLSQLQADSEKLQQEVAVLNKNPGIQSELTQQDLADIQGGLNFLQRKVRLFQSSGVINSTEGFTSGGTVEKTRATKEDLQNLQNRIYAAILTLSASGTVDPVITARIKNLQDMYSNTSDMVNKLEKGIWTAKDVPVYKEDINTIIPKLMNPKAELMDLTKQGSGKNLNPVEKQLAGFVGEDNARGVFGMLRDKGMFRVSVDLGYNVGGGDDSMLGISQKMGLDSAGNLTMHHGTRAGSSGAASASTGAGSSAASTAMDNIPTSSHGSMDGPFDSSMSGADDRAYASKQPTRFDWKQRADGVCQQVKLRGLDPNDFGCLEKNATISPAFSWRGHVKMLCTRLGATMDPGLPETCGCPPPNWSGWTLPDCISPPPGVGGPTNKRCF